MIEFNQINIEDKLIINQYLDTTTNEACDYCFSNIFMWKNHYNHSFCIIGDLLIIKMVEKITKFLFPIGVYDVDKLKNVVNTLIDYCKDEKITLTFTRVTQHQKVLLESIFPNLFITTEDRASFDYIYDAESLITLAGKKLHQKRNHINRFNENNWSIEQITLDNVDECAEFNNSWCDETNCNQSDKESPQHSCAVCLALSHLKELDMIGIILRVDGKIVAFSAGSRLNHNTVAVHIEKALSDIQGAYPAINQQFAKFASEYYGEDILFFNREDDLGIEGLRKAKLSYNPSSLVEKYDMQFLATCCI